MGDAVAVAARQRDGSDRGDVARVATATATSANGATIGSPARIASAHASALVMIGGFLGIVVACGAVGGVALDLHLRMRRTGRRRRRRRAAGTAPS